MTQLARRVVLRAQEEACRLGERLLAPEHLLLGIVGDEGCPGLTILERLEVSPGHIRQEVLRLLPRGQRFDGNMRLTLRARKVVDYACDEARQSGYSLVGTEHLLAGIIREGEGLAAALLLELGVTTERVENQAQAILQA